MYFVGHFAFKKSVLFCIVTLNTNLTSLNCKREKGIFILCCTVHVRAEYATSFGESLFVLSVPCCYISSTQFPCTKASLHRVLLWDYSVKKWQVTRILLIDTFQRSFVLIAVIFQKLIIRTFCMFCIVQNWKFNIHWLHHAVITFSSTQLVLF